MVALPFALFQVRRILLRFCYIFVDNLGLLYLMGPSTYLLWAVNSLSSSFIHGPAGSMY